MPKNFFCRQQGPAYKKYGGLIYLAYSYLYYYNRALKKVNSRIHLFNKLLPYYFLNKRHSLSCISLLPALAVMRKR